MTIPIEATPFIGLLFTLSGTPLIEWLLAGGLLRWARNKMGDSEQEIAR
jgi:hypothetical protein